MLEPNCRNKLCIWFSSCRKIFRAKVVSPPPHQTVLGSYAHVYMWSIIVFVLLQIRVGSSISCAHPRLFMWFTYFETQVEEFESI